MKKLKILFLMILSSMVFSLHSNVAYNPDFELIRNRVLADILQPPVNESQIKELISTLKPDGSWPGIDYSDFSLTGFRHRVHSENLVAMSRAYKKTGSSLKGNKDLKNAISSALNFWIANDPRAENLWFEQIGTPENLVYVLFAMDNELTKDQIEKTLVITERGNLNAQYARPSGDRIKIAGTLAKKALYLRDVDLFENTVKVIEGEVRFSVEKGMQYDYSLHHRIDRVNNTLSYGVGYATAYGEWIAFTAGTRYKFTEEKLDQFVDYYLEGICKMMVYGRYQDPGAQNRDITRRNFGDGGSGVRILEQILAATSYKKAEVQEIIDIRQGKVKSKAAFGKFFWDSEYYVHQRPKYFTSVRMFSNRNANMEIPYNREGIWNHHRGDGTNYISPTGTEYLNISPVYDWQKIPGATIMQKPQLPDEDQIQKYGVMDFTGAVTDSLYGAVAFDFISPHDPVEVKKAWFFFDDEYVCLGAGIKSEGDLPVVTTMDQSLLKGEVIVNSNGKLQTLDKKDTYQLGSTKWVFHNGIGFLFPEYADVNLSTKPQTGSWYYVNRGSSNPRDEISMDVFKLWIDHGSRLRGNSYFYIVMPSTDVQELNFAGDNPKIDVLQNTTEIQAVRHRYLNITQIVFYNSGRLLLPDGSLLSMDSPGIIMLKTDGSNVKEISVSDPTRKLGKIHFSLNRKIEKSGENFTISWDAAKGVSDISIDLPITVYAGKSVTIKL